MDFNPVPDRIRLVSSVNENLRIDPSNGGPADDTNLTFTAPATGPVTAVAYDRNFAGTAMTTLFGIDRGSSRLVRIGGVNGNPSPNLGAVTSVGLLGVAVDIGSEAGFDISGTTGTAYAALFVGGVARLYTINLVTAAATLVGTIGDGTLALRGFAVAPAAPVLVSTGPGAGGGPHVRLFQVDPLTTLATPLGGGFFAYDPGFTGGVQATLVTVGGSVYLVTGVGAGGGPHVRLFQVIDLPSGTVVPIGPGFFAYDPGFTGGVRVAATAAADGSLLILTGVGPGGGPHVRAFRVTDLATGAVAPLGGGFFAYDPGFTGGVNVGAQ
jgi:hypothetical protein